MDEEPTMTPDRAGPDGPHSDGMNEHDQLRELVIENKRLRDLVLACHSRGADAKCLRCFHAWPCPSARAAGWSRDG
jgi:hypothetical protein